VTCDFWSVNVSNIKAIMLFRYLLKILAVTFVKMASKTSSTNYVMRLLIKDDSDQMKSNKSKGKKMRSMPIMDLTSVLRLKLEMKTLITAN